MPAAEAQATSDPASERPRLVLSSPPGFAARCRAGRSAAGVRRP